jgi:serine/threonine protein kinase
MDRQPPQIQPCRYKVGKTLGAGSYSVVKECVHIDTGRCYAAKVINKRLMAGREHMVRAPEFYCFGRKLLRD